MEGDGSFDAKRRIVGAAILVTAAVVILPIVLRQPRSPAAGGQVLTVRRVAHGVHVVVSAAPVVVASRGVAATAPTSAGGPPAATAAPKGSSAAGPAKAKAGATGAAQAPPARRPAQAAAPRAWYVQVGAYVRAVDAIAFKRRLRAQGFPAHVELTRLPTGRGVVVIVGPYGRTQAGSVLQAVARRDRVRGFLIQEAAAAR